MTFLLAEEIWLMQSFLYVCMYAQVALTLPLMFQLQSDRVRSKRVCVTRTINCAKLVFTAILVGVFIAKMVIEDLRGAEWSRILYSSTVMLLSIGLCLFLSILRKEQ